MIKVMPVSWGRLASGEHPETLVHGVNTALRESQVILEHLVSMSFPVSVSFTAPESMTQNCSQMRSQDKRAGLGYPDALDAMEQKVKPVSPDCLAIVGWTVHLDIRGHRAQKESLPTAVTATRASKATPVSLAYLGVQVTQEEKGLLVRLEHRAYREVM